MFTGLIQGVGRLAGREARAGDLRLHIELGSLPRTPLALGESIAVNGVCLTVVSFDADSFAADVSNETLTCTTLGALADRRAVNLERALLASDRLGGHLVSGHVDGVGTIRSRHQEGNAIFFTIQAPGDVLKYCVVKGSITVDGISLTINDVTSEGFSVAIIPHTAKVTTLGLKQVNDSVNLESDLIGKYVERLLQERSQLPTATPIIDKDYLQRRGLI